MYDVIIVGAGPAGLTAALYCARRSLKTLVLSGDVGGQITKTYEIENYPGIDKISGIELSMRFKEQAERFGAEIILNEVKSIAKNNDAFTVKTSSAEYECQALILTFGKKPRNLNVPGEEEFKGRGVSYCATCDAPFFKNKIVAVVGGGNSALDAAILASKIAKQVYLIHRSDSFRGEQYLIDQVDGAENINILFNTEIKVVKGDNIVKSIDLNNGENLTVDGVLVEIGYVVDRSLAENLVDIDNKNQIIINNIQETSVPGIFAAGDLSQTPYKQIVISAGEGAKAALACFDYLQKKQGKHGIVADWH
jgi:thioredoxin reductase (NADPH)